MDQRVQDRVLPHISVLYGLAVNIEKNDFSVYVRFEFELFSHIKKPAFDISAKSELRFLR